MFRPFATRLFCHKGVFGHSLSRDCLAKIRHCHDATRFSKINNVHVITRDNLRISCDVWLPGKVSNASQSPEDQIRNFCSDKLRDIVLEITAYRKNDLTFHRNYRRHTEFALMGYVSVVLDVRGTGDSEGAIDASRDAADVKDVIDFLRTLPSASGKVLLMGLSLNGSMALEVVSKYPDLVTACVVLCSAGDRDALTFSQGAAIVSEIVWFSAYRLAKSALPVVRNFSVDGWLEKLESFTPSFLFEPLRRQASSASFHDNSYMRNITCPVLFFTGARDYVRNGVFALVGDNALNNLSKVVFGPWAHSYPDFARPGPSIDLMGMIELWFKQDPSVTTLPRLSALIVKMRNGGFLWSIGRV